MSPPEALPDPAIARTAHEIAGRREAESMTVKAFVSAVQARHPNATREQALWHLAHGWAQADEPRRRALPTAELGAQLYEATLRRAALTDDAAPAGLLIDTGDPGGLVLITAHAAGRDVALELTVVEDLDGCDNPTPAQWLSQAIDQRVDGVDVSDDGGPLLIYGRLLDDVDVEQRGPVIRVALRTENLNWLLVRPADRGGAHLHVTRIPASAWPHGAPAPSLRALS